MTKKPSRVFLALLIILLAVVYFISAKLGLRLALVHPSASAVWPPTGIALAALLFFGPRVWPGIFIGAFVANITTVGTIATSLGIAAGNTLEGVVGAYLVNRFAGGRYAFTRFANIFRFVVLAALISTMISATLGVTSLSLGGFAPWHNFKAIWFTWWLGDIAGGMIVAPFLLGWALKPLPRWNLRQSLEIILLFSSILLVGSHIFGVPFLPLPTKAYFCFLPILWAAYRFGPRETATAVFLLAAVAIHGTVNGFGPFIEPDLNRTLLQLQIFMGVSALMGLSLTATILERSEGESRFRLAVEASPNGMVMVNHEGKIVMVNAKTEEIFGYERGELAGQGIEILVPSRFRPQHPEYRERYIERPETRPMGAGRDLFGLHKSGREIPVEIGLNPVSTEKGRFTLASIVDITERKKATEEQQRLSRVKDEFVTMVTHELRTPLAAIKEGIDLVTEGVDGPLNKDQAATLGLVRRNIDRLSRMVSNVLDFQRMETGVGQLKFGPCDLKKLTEEVCQTMVLETEKKNVRLAMDLPPSPVQAWCDADRIKQVLINLIDNSTKFMKPNGHIVVGLEAPSEEEARLSVEDDGIGIKKEDRERIFELFNQSFQKENWRAGGFGVGLAVCKKIMALHGGRISVESESGKGTRFTLSLPRHRQELLESSQSKI